MSKKLKHWWQFLSLTACVLIPMWSKPVLADKCEGAFRILSTGSPAPVSNLIEDGKSELASIFDTIEAFKEAINRTSETGDNPSPETLLRIMKEYLDLEVRLTNWIGRLKDLLESLRSSNRSVADARVVYFQFINLRNDLLEIRSALETVQSLSGPLPRSSTDALSINTFVKMLPKQKGPKGFRINGRVQLNGHEYDVFYLLSCGSEGAVFLARREGRVFALRKQYSPVSPEKVRRHVNFSKYLRGQGINTLQIIEASPPQGIVVSEYVKESYNLAQLETALRQGEISNDQYDSARQSYEALDVKLTEVEKTSDFGNFLRDYSEGLVLDRNPDNRLYRKGQWILIDF